MALSFGRGAARIVTNRKAFDEIDLAVADGLFDLAKAIVVDAEVPDAAPLGLGLIQGGGVLAYVGKKRVGVATTGGQTSVTKPRSSGRLNPFGIVVIGGYGFPARFLEEGTVNMGPHPFLTPRLMAEIPQSEQYVKSSADRHNLSRR